MSNMRRIILFTKFRYCNLLTRYLLFQLLTSIFTAIRIEIDNFQVSYPFLMENLMILSQIGIIELVPFCVFRCFYKFFHSLYQSYYKCFGIGFFDVMTGVDIMFLLRNQKIKQMTKQMLILLSLFKMILIICILGLKFLCPKYILNFLLTFNVF